MSQESLACSEEMLKILEDSPPGRLRVDPGPPLVYPYHSHEWEMCLCTMKGPPFELPERLGSTRCVQGALLDRKIGEVR